MIHATHGKPLAALAMRGVGAVWVDGDEVKRRAALFDDALWKFNQDADNNPVFAKRLWEAYPPAQKTAHEAFITNLSSVDYDWQGDGTDEVPGYYKKLKGMLWLGQAELSTVQDYEARLDSLRKQYKKLNYKETIPAGPDPEKNAGTDDQVSWTWVKWVVVLGIGAYIIGQIAPVIGITAASRAFSKV